MNRLLLTKVLTVRPVLRMVLVLAAFAIPWQAEGQAATDAIYGYDGNEYLAGDAAERLTFLGGLRDGILWAASFSIFMEEQERGERLTPITRLIGCEAVDTPFVMLDIINNYVEANPARGDSPMVSLFMEAMGIACATNKPLSQRRLLGSILHRTPWKGTDARSHHPPERSPRGPLPHRVGTR